ncbi:hypothetical protein [Hydrocarboniphaga sp.]|uniref:hypothetical protein n=1 Tax=Hydrocarboniphaga sp. TaxID=2033016 RepID=UPI002616D941|nr:hypothetical protein [Hydrocarboniphaga sp.]
MWNFHLERVFKGYDLDRPCFVRDMDQIRTWGLPTPDHHYFSAQIDGMGEYRIIGNRGNTVDYCFEILSGLAGDDGVVGDRIDALETGRLQTDADGRFELFVGGSPRSGNWMKAGAKARTVFVRQTVNDWTREQPTPMLIERLGEGRAKLPFRRPSPDEVQALFVQAATELVHQVRFMNDFSLNWAQILPLNELQAPAVGPADAGYFPGQFNTKCRFKVHADQALIITMEPSTALYQSLALAHPHWFNSIHYRNVQSSLNATQSRVSSDGLFRFVISPKDPGVYNWLDTAGLESGFLFVRLQRLVSGRPPKKLDTKLVPFTAVRDEFPADEQRVDQETRFAIQRIRRLSADKRYA